VKFTIFTSFYNYLDTFDDLAQSILGQTYQDWEWIISDDFSENPEVLPRLQSLVESSEKIKLVHPSFKKEFYWNPPTSHSTGDIFLVQDSDDLMHPKLLEVYRYNFDRFPKVQMISTNSVLRWGSVHGEIHSFRLINYKDRCNFIQKIRSAEFGEYNIGDCRAWRNNVNLFDPDYKWKFCADDVCKTLINEEKGMLLYLPRVLHTYAHREESISHTKTANIGHLSEGDVMINEAEERKSRKFLSSVEDYYDRIYPHTTPFYLSSLNLEKSSKTVEYFSPSLNNREIEILRDLYFDHDLVFEFTPDVDYLIHRIETADQTSILRERLSFLPRRQIILELDLDLKQEVSDLLLELNLPHYWFIFGKVTIIVDF
jgi:hypothetical protein